MGMTSMAQVSPVMKTKCISYSMTGIKGLTLFFGFEIKLNLHFHSLQLIPSIKLIQK